LLFATERVTARACCVHDSGLFVLFWQ